MPSVAVDKFAVVGKNIKSDNVSLHQKINRILLLKYRYRGFFPSDFVPTLENVTFAIIKMQPGNMRGDHWKIIANSRQKLCFADSLCRKNYCFFKQQFEQMMQNHYSPVPTLAVSTRYMQLFISSNTDKNKLQEFAMLMYFHSQVITSVFPVFLL